MFKKKLILFLYVFLIIVLSACNLPSGGDSNGGDNPGTVDDLALTVTAQFILFNQQSATPAFTATVGPSSTPENTATPTVPQVTVTTDTNCRVGPGLIYDRVGGVNVGQVAEVVGKNSSVPNYWVIKNLNGSGTCWLWGQYATVTGNTANLPEYPVPPTPTPTATNTPTFTPTPALPVAVSNVAIAKFCNSAFPFIIYQYGGTLSWTDNSNNENGFNIYHNGGLHSSVGANATSFELPVLPFPPGVPQTWGVEAYNAAGKAAIKTTVFNCP